MPKPRSELSAGEVSELLSYLDRRLELLGVESRPEVACRVLKLVQDPCASLADFARIIRADQGLSGRLLRIANSACFAQARAVTNLDRACVLLGVERLRSFSLGFHLSRAAAGTQTVALSRRVWTHSVFRAFLACELAKEIIPRLSAEAFIIGLMLDAGIPLMMRLLGEPYEALLAANPGPTDLHRAEFRTLPFTHVDVMAALCARWRLPELLGQPIQWHHAAPADTRRRDPIGILQRIAAYVGALDLREVQEDAAPPVADSSAAERLLGLPGKGLDAVNARACAEYRSTVSLFGDIASALDRIEVLAAAAHGRLAAEMDQQIIRALQGGEIQGPARFVVGGSQLEIACEAGGHAVACLFDGRGNPLASHRFCIIEETPESLCESLGLHATSEDELERLSRYLRGAA